jgi:hypothetical protein
VGTDLNAIEAIDMHTHVTVSVNGGEVIRLDGAIRLSPR